MKRLFQPDGKCFDLAMDHGFFNEFDFLNGMEDMSKAVVQAVDAGPDALQLTPGQSELLQTIPGRHKPSLVLRLDTNNVYSRELPDHLFSQIISDPIEEAVRMDAACVIVNLFYTPGRPHLYHQCLENVAMVRAQCRRLGMPLMVEPLVMLPGFRGGFDSDGDARQLVPLVRQAVEMGADIIKCEPTVESGDFHLVVQAASGRPVLARGGGKMEERLIFQRTWELLQEGSSGLIYGRNVNQHPHPKAMVHAFLAMVHQGIKPSEAEELVREESAVAR